MSRPKLLERFGRPTDGQDLDLAGRELPNVPRRLPKSACATGAVQAILPVDGSASSSPTIRKVACLVLAQDGDRHSEHHVIGLWVRLGNLRAGEPGRPVAQLPCSSAQSLPIGCGGRARQIVLVSSNPALDQPQAATCHQIAMRADRTIRQSDHASIGIILFDEGPAHRSSHSGSGLRVPAAG